MDFKSSIVSCIAFLYGFAAMAQRDADFVSVPAGTYTVGKKGHPVNPLRNVSVGRFSVATTEVTVTQFFEFVKATGYITDAERLYNAMIWKPGVKEFEWKQDSSANWKYPNGKDKGLIFDGKMDHPVTCISYTDALLYCKWAGVRMPSIDEWEIASRAGAATDYFFGNDSTQLSVYANIWHGATHAIADSSVDKFQFTSPVASFKPNPLGLFDMYGNVFEFCSGKLPGDKSDDIVHARGGSWWCSRNTCHYFNSVEIGRVSRHASFSNHGFRVVK